MGVHQGALYLNNKVRILLNTTVVLYRSTTTLPPTTINQPHLPPTHRSIFDLSIGVGGRGGGGREGGGSLKSMIWLYRQCGSIPRLWKRR